ncbi:MAG: hypothetical protein EOO03_02455 [Chitinophagaceae bacterium]|nr:MAG: hypothetical protein EOO03_02455 [Chitinophagaceae bacterium]
MWKSQTKALVLLMAVIIAAPASKASNGDTLKTKAPAAVGLANDCPMVLKAANVMYPTAWQGCQDQFKSYVEKFSISRRAYLQRTYTRSKQFFPKATIILKKYNVPSEFAVLLALESAFNGNAVSSAGAVGYWQIMDDVAKEYGLKIVEKQHKPVSTKDKKTVGSTGKKAATAKTPTDDRKNFLKSTHTAARYLKDRMRNLNNDWLLVAASYNWGVGNVWNAMERTGLKNPTFWDIKQQLPAETRSYVMNFIALNVIFKNYENFRSNKLCFNDVPEATASNADVAMD